MSIVDKVLKEAGQLPANTMVQELSRPSKMPKEEYHSYLTDLKERINHSNILPSTIGTIRNIRAAIVDGGWGYSYGSPDVSPDYKICIIGDGIRKKPFKPSTAFKATYATIFDGTIYTSDWDIEVSKQLCKKLSDLLMFDLESN